MRLVVLNVADPFAPVGPDASGGAEQVLTQLDAGLVRAGHESIVMACEGSTAEGILLSTTRPGDALDDAVRRKSFEQYRFILAKFLEKWPIDLIHVHGADFHEYLPPAGVPVLATLHQALDWYPPQIFSLDRPQTFLQCVSAAQRAACPPCGALLPEIENGPAPELFSSRHAKRPFALALGRISPERGFDLALDAARHARVPMLLGGEIFRQAAHENYFN